jgi:hypothetical protein
VARFYPVIARRGYPVGRSKAEKPEPFSANYPPDHLNDEAAMNAIRAFFRMGMEGLKQKVEQGRRVPS